MRASRTVIVHGPPRCGKSRAAANAAASVLAEVPAIIPLDAPSLNSLLDGGVDLPLTHPELCLWLDGLDRFTGVLDPCSIESAQTASKPAARIVATVRTDDWTKLLDGTGQDSEAARALAQNARIVELSEFTPAAADGREPPGAPPVAAVHGLRTDPPFLGLVAAFVAVVVVAAILLASGQITNPPSISTQIDQITSELASAAGPGGGRVVADERVPFHSADQPSWMIVVQDLPTAAEFQNGAGNGGSPAPRSDDVRIYDVVGDRLKLEFEFRPAGVGQLASEWESLSAGAPAYADYAQDGSQAVIGGFARPSQATSAVVPVAIKWQDGRYVLVALTPEPPNLSTAGMQGAILSFRQAAYETRVTLANAVRAPRFAALTVSGYRVQSFALARTPTLRLLTGYFARFPVYAHPHMLEVHANQIRPGLAIAPCTPTYFACPAPTAAPKVIIPPDKSLDNGLLQAWALVAKQFTTRVRVVQGSG
jgi:hypothetical protein